MRYGTLTITDPRDLVFGRAPHPVRTMRGLEIGGGTVYAELNFTLPPTRIDRSTLPELERQYRQIVEGALTRAVELESPGVVVEFETLVEMTRDPELGVALVRVLDEACGRFHVRHGLATALRLTPNDLREFERPPRMRSGPLLDRMLELFERGAEAGGELLSIESTGGKELSDEALMSCDIALFVFTQAVLGVRDVRMLWERIVEIALRTGRIPAGDTACAFGNTAMVLAESRFIPRVMAAIARVATVARSLAAVEAGATGPSKDCAYEGPYLKAIAGIPVSMEGRMASCAHFSPVGNVSASCADLWSNESVQNVRLLSDYAPTVSMEQLEYDARLMNAALARGEELVLRDLFAASDRGRDPQAFVLTPEVIVPVAGEIVKASNPVQGTRNACLAALDLIEDAVGQGALRLADMERPWLGTLRDGLESIPDTEAEFIERMRPHLDPSRISPAEYGL